MFYGPVKFDGTGRNIAKPMALTQVQGGYVAVFPAKLATGAAIVPRPPRAP
jgi:branched-chain amino acid transport system substrate-binding protein